MKVSANLHFNAGIVEEIYGGTSKHFKNIFLVIRRLSNKSVPLYMASL